MDSNSPIYVTSKGTIFIAGGTGEYLFPLKKGTSEFIYINQHGVYLCNASITTGGYTIDLLTTEHYSLIMGEYKPVRTIYNDLVYVSGHAAPYTSSPRETMCCWSPTSILGSSPVGDFIKTWILDIDSEYELQFSDGHPAVTLYPRIHSATICIHLTSAQRATLNNFAFKLSLEV